MFDKAGRVLFWLLGLGGAPRLSSVPFFFRHGCDVALGSNQPLSQTGLNRHFSYCNGREAFVLGPSSTIHCAFEARPVQHCMWLTPSQC